MMPPFVALWLAANPAAEDLSNLETAMTRHTRDRYVADLEEVKRRGVLRVLTRNNSSNYFLARATERGFQFELARAFARHLGVRLAMVVPPSRDALIAALLDGEGDLIAAGMSVTRARGEKVLFTPTVLTARRVVATHRHTVRTLDRLEDLPTFLIHVDFHSTTLRDLRRAEAELDRRLRIAPVTDGVEMEEMLRRVSEGAYEATVADAQLVDLAVAAGLAVTSRVELGTPRPKAWAVHPASPDLRDAAARFLARNRNLVAIFRKRYFSPSSRFAERAREAEFRADVRGKLSPYDRFLKKAARETGLDWRLLAAVAFTESRFDPNAESPWGAMGLMQVLPETAASVGIRDRLKDPERNILAGARYLARLARRFEVEGVAKRQRVRFALASYNAGLGHIIDARKLAAMTERDPNRWFHHVEDALRLKTDRRWHERTRHGYARAHETIRYVSKIQSRYDVYVRHVPLQAGEAGPIAP